MHLNVLSKGQMETDEAGNRFGSTSLVCECRRPSKRTSQVYFQLSHKVASQGPTEQRIAPSGKKQNKACVSKLFKKSRLTSSWLTCSGHMPLTAGPIISGQASEGRRWRGNEVRFLSAGGAMRGCFCPRRSKNLAKKGNQNDLPRLASCQNYSCESVISVRQWWDAWRM